MTGGHAEPVIPFDRKRRRVIPFEPLLPVVNDSYRAMSC